MEGEKRYGLKDVIYGLGCCYKQAREGTSCEDLNCPFYGQGKDGEPCYAIAMGLAQSILSIYTTTAFLIPDKRILVDVPYWAEREMSGSIYPVAFKGESESAFISYLGSNYPKSAYNVRWRLWSSKPTEAQMEEAPWKKD